MLLWFRCNLNILGLVSVEGHLCMSALLHHHDDWQEHHTSLQQPSSNDVNNWTRCTRRTITLISCGDPSPALTLTYSTDVIYSQHVAAGWATTPPHCYRWPERGRSRWCRWAPGCMESQRNRRSEASQENKASSTSSPARGPAPPPSPEHTDAGTAELIHHGWSMNTL